MLTCTAPSLMRYFSGALLVVLMALPVQAQIMAELTCSGPSVAGWIVVQGLRQSLPYTPLGDAQVWFNGTLTGDFGQLQMHYEGYTPLAPFDGILVAPQFTVLIKVLENISEPHIIIYDGRATLYAPNELAQLNCSWRYAS
jgi:hypothetical protein